MKLQQFDMVVRYRKGEENGAADFVSRLHEMPDGTYEVRTIHALDTAVQPNVGGTGRRIQVQVELQPQHRSLEWQDVREAQETDEWVQSIARYLDTAELPDNKRVAS